MDHDEFLNKLGQVVIFGTGVNARGTRVESGPVVKSLKHTPGTCGDCGLITEHAPRRVYAYKGHARTARCLECRMVQNRPGTAFAEWRVTTRPKE